MAGSWLTAVALLSTRPGGPGTPLIIPLVIASAVLLTALLLYVVVKHLARWMVFAIPLVSGLCVVAIGDVEDPYLRLMGAALALAAGVAGTLACLFILGLPSFVRPLQP